MERISIFITDMCKKKGIIEKDYDIYCYGFTVLLSVLSSMLLIIIVGLLLDRLTEAIFYYIFFGNIREYSGGYHADTQYKCSICYCGIFVASLLLIDNYYILTRIVALISMLAIWGLAPVTHPNKPNSASMMKKAKCRTIILTIVFCLLAEIGELYSISSLRIIYPIMIFVLLLMYLQLWKERNQINEN
jgi:accessory gene regulator B